MRHKPFDAAPYDELVRTAAMAFLTDTHYSLDIARASNKYKDRVALYANKNSNKI